MRIGLGIGLNRFRGGQAAAGVVGLLDSYKGSAFAMSPDTLLYSTYSATDDIVGSVTNGDTGQFSVAILRDSDNAVRSFTPAEVADGTANTWVQAGVGGAANGFVRRGYDQSVTALNVSNLNHADQSDPTKMPKLFDSATGLILENGKAAIKSINKVLSLGDIISGSSAITSFCVGKAQSGAALISKGINRTGDREWGMFADIINRGFFVFQDTPTLFGGSGTATANQYQLWYGNYSSGVVSYAENSIVIGTGSFSGSIQDLNAELLIGADEVELYETKYSCFVIFQNDQSTNRSDIETAINNEYNIY